LVHIASNVRRAKQEKNTCTTVSLETNKQIHLYKKATMPFKWFLSHQINNKLFLKMVSAHSVISSYAFE